MNERIAINLQTMKDSQIDQELAGVKAKFLLMSDRNENQAARIREQNDHIATLEARLAALEDVVLRAEHLLAALDSFDQREEAMKLQDVLDKLGGIDD